MAPSAGLRGVSVSYLSIHFRAQSAFLATQGMLFIALNRKFFCAASLMYASMSREYISV